MLTKSGHNRTLSAVGAVILFAARLLPAAPAHDTSPSDLAAQAQQLLQARCFECHGPEKHKSGLRLDSRDAALRGGDTSDHVIVISKSGQSELIKRITSDDPDVVMPPKGARLSQADIDLLRRWIDRGAAWPSAADAINPLSAQSAITPQQRAFWAFQPVTKQSPPPVRQASWVKTPIDAFILARLEKEGIPPAPPATKLELIRRVAFDLTGLPPTLAETETYLHDNAADAYERMVDHYLQSPRYGERWGQHWLDVVRFAETEGFEYDRLVPGLWRYRDYVIDAFNQDKPYNQFIIEQIAGDEIEPLSQQLQIAAGFNRLGPVRRNAGNQDVASSRNEVLTDRTDIVGAAFLGLTMGCCRCHDHKFDPILQKDYYRLQAFFAAADEHNIALATEAEEREWKTKTTAINAKLAQLKRQLKASEDDKEKRRIQEEMEAIEDTLPPPLSSVVTVKDSDTPTPIHILKRGDAEKPSEAVGMRAPSVLVSEETAELPLEIKKPRLELARWLADPKHPLTARVMVNRIWTNHFGAGLVKTPNDFGQNGARPSHPELLDYLAATFIENGWHLKPIHRLILLSNTYRQSSHIPSPGTPGEGKGGGHVALPPAVGSALADAQNPPSAKADPARLDPDNQLLSHFNRRRLSAEEVRDAMLAVSGELNPRMGGESILIPVDKDLIGQLYKPSQWVVTRDPKEHNRRSIYLLAKRNLRLPFMETFDQPTAQSSCGRRETSTHAPQALELLNGTISNDLAARFADRLAHQAGGNPQAQIQLAFKLAAGRPPTSEEIRLANEFLKQQSLKEFALAIFNLNAFLYVN